MKSVVRGPWSVARRNSRTYHRRTTAWTGACGSSLTVWAVEATACRKPPKNSRVCPACARYQDMLDSVEISSEVMCSLMVLGCRWPVAGLPPGQYMVCIGHMPQI